MNIKTAFSTNAAVEDAVQEVQRQLAAPPEARGDARAPRVVLFFASPAYAPDRLSRLMQDAFPASRVFGCTSAGEIVGSPSGDGASNGASDGHMLKQSIVAMALDEEIVGDVAAQVIDVDDPEGVGDAFDTFEQHFGLSMREMDPSEYVGLVLVDGLSGAEERVNDEIGNLTNVLFVGGSAGDDLKFEQTHIFAGGQAHANAALLLLMKPRVAFDIVKTQSFEVLEEELVPTQVNEATREVLEFGNEPAAEAYAEAVACPVEEASERFMRHPVGLMVGEEPFVRSPQRFDGSNIVFYCDVKEGMPLRLLKTRDIVSDTQQALAEKKKEMNGFSAVINFHCILRTLELEDKEQTEPYGKLFSETPTVGLSTYGESYIGHINQTSTMLVFGHEPAA